MNEELSKHAKNNDFNSFKLAYEPLYPNGNAQTAFNAMKAELSKSGSSRYGSTGDAIQNVTSGDYFTKAANSTFVGRLGGMLSDFTRGLANGINGIISTQFGAKEEQNAAGSILNVLGEGGLNPAKLIQKGGAEVIQALNTELTNESKLLTEINSKTGISGELSKGLQDDMKQASIEASKYGITINELGDFYTKLSDNSGKFALVNRGILDSAAPVATVLGKTMSEMADIMSQYETVGLGVDKTIKELDNAATRTIGLGLNARTVSKTMTEQIGRLNEYGFQNGIQGLERMSQKAVEFRMSMDQVFKLADNVFTPEKAIELSASLQVLGGAMGDFNDPIKLMYMATNNVEGLQDALIGATQGLATYNQEQGKFEITGINIRKAHEMANALGVDYKELTKSAIAGAERMSATNALMANSITSNMNDKDKEFLINMSRMEGGEMKIVVPESLQKSFGNVTEIAMDKLTSSQVTQLTEYQKQFEKMDSKAIAMSQLTETQKMVRDLDVVASYYRVQTAQYLRGAGTAFLKSELGKSMQSALNNMSEEDKKKNIYGSSKEAEDKIVGMTNAIGNAANKALDIAKEGWDKVTGKNSPTTQPTTQNVNVTFYHKSEGTITDSVFDGVRKNPTSMSNFVSMSPKDFTTPNPAHKK